jgi:hypothetical protein
MNKLKQWIKKHILESYSLQLLFWYVALLFILYKIGQWTF